ncbi:MAG: transposase [Candidatus Hydrogenedentota bacterium]
MERSQGRRGGYLGRFEPQYLEMLKKTLEAAISADLTRYLCAGRYARDEKRVDYRCGVNYRDLETEFGLIERLRVARCRQIGNMLKLIISDGSPGLHKALEKIYPYTLVQRCWVHLTRNVKDKINRSDEGNTLI